MNNKLEGNEQDNWYIYINQQTRGPLALRDLDVLIRTNQINSRTLGWKSEMKQWKPLNQIEQIKMSILESSNQILEIERKKVGILDQKPDGNQKAPQNQQVVQQEVDQQIQNNDQDPLAILEVTVQNLIKKSFHQSSDGKWSIYDEQKQEWVLQDQQPTQKINQMKNHLFNKLKSQLFFNEKNNKKNKHLEAQSKAQQNLTKQQLEKRQKNRKKAKRAAEKKKQKWYNAKINTYIYMSGLPYDVTEQEIKEFAAKAGVLRIDLNTGKQKIRLYKDQNDFPKGDAAVSYARPQSVELALQILNGRQIRTGFVVKVERAKFNQKQQQYRPRQLKKLNKIQKVVAKKMQQKQLAWDEQLENDEQGFRIVVLKHIFTPQIANNDSEVRQIKEDLEIQMNKIGEIKKIKFHENHPDGVVEVKFKDPKDAEKCIELNNQRFFDGRKIICEYWDGQTNYDRDAASIALQMERLQKFADLLQGRNGDNNQEKAENQKDQQVQLDKNIQ